MDNVKSFLSFVISLEWITRFVRLLTKTAGNIAESVFILASLWVIINMVAHKFLLLFIHPEIIEYTNQLALISFSALPELIFVLTLERTLLLWKHKERIWGLLYSIPCIAFVYLTTSAFFKFTNSSGEASTLAGFELVIRVLIGYYYSVLNQMFSKLKEPNLFSELGRLKSELENLKGELENLKNKRKPASKADREVVIKPSNWLIEQANKGEKTVELARLIEETGLSKRQVNALIKDGILELDRRNNQRIRMTSVCRWLEIYLPDIPKAV